MLDSSSYTRRLSSGRAVRIAIIVVCLIVTAIAFRQIPYQSVSFAPSHFRFGRYNTIIVAAESGFYPGSQSAASIANLRVSVEDHWTHIFYHATMLNFFGFESESERFWYFRYIVPTPLALGGALVTLARVKYASIPWWAQVFLFVFPWYGGLLFVNRTNSSLNGFSFGAALFVLCIVGFLQVESGNKPRRWGLLTVIFALSTAAFRHTAGLILVMCVLSLFVGTFLLPLRNGMHLRSLCILSVVILFVNSAIIFQFYTGQLARAALFFTDLVQSSTGIAATPGEKSVSIDLETVVPFTDHMFIWMLVSIAGILGLVVAIQYWVNQAETMLDSTLKIYEPKFRFLSTDTIRSDPTLRNLLVYGALLIGVAFSVVVFAIYSGVGGVVRRTTQYGTIFAYIALPLLLQLAYRRKPASRVSGSASETWRAHLGVFTIVVMLVLSLVSPLALFASATISSSSQYLTPAEATGTTTSGKYIPQDDRIYGSYHIGPPYAATHEHVVGFGFRRFTNAEIQLLLEGLYYDPNTDSTSRTLKSLENEYGNIDFMVFSTRERGDLGINSRAQKWPSAPQSHPQGHDDQPISNRIFTNGEVIVYNLPETNSGR